jgi:hypothetical protein
VLVYTVDSGGVVQGEWAIVVKAATGASKGTLVLDEGGGRVLSPTGNAELDEVTVSGSSFVAKGKVKGVMPMSVTIEADVDGDALTGTMKVGFFGTATLTGTRV